MAVAKVHKRKQNVHHVFIGVLFVLIIGFALSFVLVGTAQGSDESDSSAVGLSKNQMYSTQTSLSAQDRINPSSSDSVTEEATETIDPRTSAQRSITVKDPDPVVVPVAVDESNPTAVEKAKTVCTLNPLPTAPRVAPDVSDGTWTVGIASAYDVEPNDPGDGSLNITASGIRLHEGSLTVAVPQSKSYLLGSIVEICYNGNVVIATVTDTGGFEGYGRALDLAPGVFKALGASTSHEWGTRTISYRYI